VTVPGRRRRAGKKEVDTSLWSDEQRTAHEHRLKLETPVAEMKLSVRVINTLDEAGVITAKDVMEQTYESLMRMRNFGETTLVELRGAVKALGLQPPQWRKPPRGKKSHPPRPTRGGSIIPMW
jgi:DNA-directed RNA polymerase alpha subunit